MKKLITTSLLISFAGAGPAFAAASPAGKAPAMQTAPAGAAATPTVSQAELQNFVQAYEALRPVRMKYVNELRQTKDKDKQAQIKQQGMTEMKHKISEYMPLSQYVQVGRAINENPVLRKRFMQALEVSKVPAAGTGG